LLLLFLILLALSWRMTSLQREAEDGRKQAQTLATRVDELQGGLDALAPLFDELRKGALDAESIQALAARLGRAAKLEKDNETLKEDVTKLTNIVGGLRAVGADLAKLKQVKEAIDSALSVNPNDPAEFLKRSVDVMKVLGTDTRADDVRSLSEMTADNDKMVALNPAIALGSQINPSDPAEALKRAAEVLLHVGRDAKPEDVLPLDRQTALASQVTTLNTRIANMARTGNGLTYPSCWMTPEGKTEYFFEISIQEGGFLLREATTGRANDPAMRLVSALPRDTLVRESVFDRETAELFKSGQSQSCRYYSIVRDQTGPTSKVRYKALLKVVENHFYKYELHTPGTEQGVGGPYVRPDQALGASRTINSRKPKAL
jgi:hypothetical protein